MHRCGHGVVYRWVLLFCLVPVGAFATVTRARFCAALLSTARTSPRVADPSPFGNVVAQTARFRSLQNQMLTDVRFGRSASLANYLGTLAKGVVVGREFRGFGEVGVALCRLRAEIADETPSVPSTTPARRASSLGLAALPMLALEGGTIALPLALGLIFANEFVVPGWRARRDDVRGLATQLEIIERVLTERERLDGGGRALSIVTGRVRLPVRLHRALVRGVRLTAADMSDSLRETGELREVLFDSLFYTDLRTAEPRWLLYYRVPPVDDPDPRAPPRPADRGLLTEF